MKTLLLIASLFVATAAYSEPAKTFTIERFTFTVPDGWKKVPPPSPMRKAQLEVGEDAAKAEVTFFHFGGGSGSVADNVSALVFAIPGQRSDAQERDGGSERRENHVRGSGGHV